MPSTFLFLISSSVLLLLFSLVLCACVCLLVDFCVSLISCLLPILSASLVHGHCCFIQQVSISPCVMYYIVGLFFLCFFVCCLLSPAASVCGFCDALCSWGVCVLYQLFVCVIDVEVSVSACLCVDLSVSVDVFLLGSVCESHAFLCLCLYRFLVC